MVVEQSNQTSHDGSLTKSVDEGGGSKDGKQRKKSSEMHKRKKVTSESDWE